LNVPSSDLYYQPVPEKPDNVKMMNIMDKHLLKHPTEGILSIINFLKEKGYPVGPKRISRLFKVTGWQTIYRRKNLTKHGLKQFIKPYLLRNLEITHSNQVWCTDITYVPIPKGYKYMIAFLDVYSRKIMGWSISNSMSKQCCVAALKEVIDANGKPKIINSDQGSQFASAM